MTALHETPLDLLFASACASTRFALACLEPVGSHLRARSSFVDPTGAVMHWHDFGDLEGPGWAANAVGGAHLLYLWGRYTCDATMQTQALRLLDHILDDGFIAADGFIWPYWDLAQNRFCLNYKHNHDWLCPGSLAKIGVQMLEFAADLDTDPRAARLRSAAQGLGDWLAAKVPLLDNDWVPRRITLAGVPYPLTPEGGPDAIFANSADGLFLLDLYVRLGRWDAARYLADAFVESRGFWGSLNHDTYDNHENVAYAVAFDVLRRAADALHQPTWREFAYTAALPAMQHFRMAEDRHGVRTQGLFWMEASWDTAYLWENAEVAQAHLAAWLERGDESACDTAVAILDAIAHHHYGDLGFLTEGVDWNNHVGQQHHIGGALYGAIQYTEPLLNALHFVGPTLTYLTAQSYSPPQSWDVVASLRQLRTLLAD